jgi:hypothetical protein
MLPITLAGPKQKLHHQNSSILQWSMFEHAATPNSVIKKPANANDKRVPKKRHFACANARANRREVPGSNQANNFET